MTTLDALRETHRRLGSQIETLAAELAGTPASTPSPSPNLEAALVDLLPSDGWIDIPTLRQRLGLSPS